MTWWWGAFAASAFWILLLTLLWIQRRKTDQWTWDWVEKVEDDRDAAIDVVNRAVAWLGNRYSAAAELDLIHTLEWWLERNMSAQARKERRERREEDDRGVEVWRPTPDEWHEWVAARLQELGLTFGELARQARNGSFVSTDAANLWVVIGGPNVDLVYGDPCVVCGKDGWPMGSAGNARRGHELDQHEDDPRVEPRWWPPKGLKPPSP